MKVINSAGQILYISPGGGGGGTTFSAGVSTGGNTLGSTGTVSNQVVFVGTNGITLSQSTNAGGNATITFSGPGAGVQSAVNAFGVSNTGTTLGNTGVSSGITWVVAASGNITASQSTVGGGPNTVWLSVPASVAQTTQPAVNAFGVSNTGNTAGNTGTSSGITWVLGGSNALTLSQSTAGGGPNTVWIQGPLSATTISQVSTANAIGTRGSRFALEDHQHLGVAALAPGSNTGNTAGNTATQPGGTWVIAGSSPITISGSSGAAGIHTAWVQMSQTNQQMTMFATGNTTQSSTGTTNASSLIFAGSGIASVGITNGSVLISVPAGGGAGDGGVFAGVSTAGNTAGSTGTVSTGNFVLVGSNGITLSQSTGAAGSAATVTILGDPPLSTYEPFPFAGWSTGGASVNQATSGVVSVFPFVLAEPVSAGVLNMMASFQFSTVGTSSGRQTAGLAMGIYTRNGSTLSSITSNSFSWQVTGNNSSYTINQVTVTSYSGYGATGATNSAGSNISSNYTGMKMIAWPMNTMLSPGNYWLGILGTASSSSVTVGLSLAFIGGPLATGAGAFSAAPIGSLSSGYSTGQDPFGGRWHLGQGLWSSAGSVTNVPVSMAFNSISANVGASVFPMMKFWST